MKSLLLSLYCILSCLSTGVSGAQTQVSGENLLKGQKVEVSAQGKKGMVIIFLSAKCPCSNSHIAELKDLMENFGDFSFVAIHSNMDEGRELTRSYFEKISLPFPVIEDQKAKLADQFRALKTPHAYVISPSGEELYRGGVSSSMDFARANRKFLREALEDIRSGQKVRTAESRALGCAISRSRRNAF